ncbi:hypothetical protein [Streptomyces syringium]|uniref:hypothetical protein n=1 Tax=Streptomyces syringium TaxID=76729 RepID=UPI0033EB506E
MTADATRADFRTLHYADDLTVGHVDGLADFLATKLAPLRDASERDTEAYRAAEALDSLVRDLAADLRHGIDKRDADIASGTDSHGALVTRQQIRRDWNRLVLIAEQWRDASDAHRYAPWHRVQHLSAQTEADDRAHLARLATEAEA